jgi:hypothetical protein
VTVTRPHPEFSLKDLLPGDIYVSEDIKRMWSVSPGKNHLVISTPELEIPDPSRFLFVSWSVKALNLKTQMKEVLIGGDGELMDGKVYRNGEVIWDYDDRE